jgi:PAS domain S-box-containing protein
MKLTPQVTGLLTQAGLDPGSAVERTEWRRFLELVSEALTERDQSGDDTHRQLLEFARATRDSIAVRDLSGRYLLVNRAWHQLLGVETSPVGRTLLELEECHSTTARKLHDAHQQFVASGEESSLRNLDLEHLSDRMISVQLSFSLIRAQDGQPVATLTVGHDVTELVAARESAEATAAAKVELVATMSHEIRTPLNGIIVSSTVLLDSALTSEQQRLCSIIRSSGEVLLGLINSVLDYSRLECGQMTLERRDFELGRLLRETVSMLELQAREKGLELDLTIDDRVPPYVTGDPGRLQQVLLNLIGNAVKFTARGSVRVAVSREHDALASNLLRFEVSDTGIGINPGSIDRLFRLFSQVDPAVSRQHGGSGLGLAISRRLVKLMQGEIGVQSTPGAGSSFWFTAALTPAERVARQPQAPISTALAPGAFAPLAVLVAEDNRVSLELLLRVLKRLGVDADVAENGCDALLATARRSYDLIFMDCQMPEMDGYEATREIRAREAQVGESVMIVALTANALPGDREKCLAAGMDNYIAKPFQIPEIEAALRTALSRRKTGCMLPA